VLLATVVRAVVRSYSGTVAELQAFQREYKCASNCTGTDVSDPIPQPDSNEDRREAAMSMVSRTVVF